MKNKIVSYREFIHPDDDYARQQLESVPGFTIAIKTFMNVWSEQFLHGINMSSKIRITSRQFPDIYRKMASTSARFGIDEPEFYLEMDPYPNAYTYGDTQAFLTVTSGLLEYLDDNESESVIAHECGHIVCRHVLYRTMANYILKGADFFGIIGKVAIPIQLALLYWSRCSELSADRASAVLMGSAQPVVETMVRLSGGPKSITGSINLEEFEAQADCYDKLKGSGWQNILQGIAVMNQSHPFPAVRIREIKKWAKGSSFEKLVCAMKDAKTITFCPKCSSKANKDWAFCQECGEKI